MTIKPLVRILHVKLRGKEEMNMYAELNDKVWNHDRDECENLIYSYNEKF